MLQDRLTLLIHSCGAYSDLWDGQIEMLTRNWNHRNIRTIILTDQNPSAYAYPDIEIVCAGKGKEITERISYILPKINTEFVFVTLDDYFLLQPVDNVRISYLLDQMEKQSLDYIRLFPNPPSKDRIGEELFRIHPEEKKSNYYINLYAGIWRKSFIEKTIEHPINAWQYEVSLTPLVQKLKTSCAMTNGKEYIILDVVRKGKLLHKAKRYFKKDPVYRGHRPVIEWKHEISIAFKDLIKRCLPRSIQQLLKKLMIKCGKTFYSPLDE